MMTNYFSDSQGKTLTLRTVERTFKPLFRKETTIPCIKIETDIGWAIFDLEEFNTKNENIVAAKSKSGDAFLTHKTIAAKSSYFEEITQGVPDDCWVLTFMALSNPVQAIFSEERFQELVAVIKTLSTNAT